jgi:hypothetical protein
MAVPETALLAFIVNKGTRSGILAGACSLLCSYIVPVLAIKVVFAVCTFLKLTDRKTKLNRIKQFVSRQLFIQSFAGTIILMLRRGKHLLDRWTSQLFSHIDGVDWVLLNAVADGCLHAGIP